MSSSSESAEKPPQTAALLFEFDHLVANIREATLDVLKTIFDDQDLQPMHLSRYALNVSPQKAVENVQAALGIKKGTPKKLGDEVINGIRMHLETGNIQVSDELRDVIVQARERDMPIYALTALPEGPRSILEDRLDLSGLGIEYAPFGSQFESYPRADAWLKMCKDHGLLAPVSLALTTSMAATKAAMTAGVHCVAIPDRFTAFQDFSGCQAVVDSPKDVVLADVLKQSYATA
jgi:hypothetical protein